MWRRELFEWVNISTLWIEQSDFVFSYIRLNEIFYVKNLHFILTRALRLEFTWAKLWSLPLFGLNFSKLHFNSTWSQRDEFLWIHLWKWPLMGFKWLKFACTCIFKFLREKKMTFDRRKLNGFCSIFSTFSYIKMEVTWSLRELDFFKANRCKSLAS